MEKLISKIRKIFSQKKLMPSGASWEAENEIIKEVRKHFESKTGAQNRTWHKLVQIYYDSGQHSYPSVNFLHFRSLIKLHLGAGCERYNRIFDYKGNPLENPITDYRLKSVSDYSKEEMKSAIERLISDMSQNQIQTGKYSKEFEEIMIGIEK